MAILRWRHDRFRDDDGQKIRLKYGFRIVHQSIHSPRRKAGRDCYYSDQERGGDLDLIHFLGAEGLVSLLQWMDVGEEFDEDYIGPELHDIREWAVIVRRLHIPYYEQARKFLSRAKRENFYDHNPVAFYLPGTLKEIVEEYSQEEE